jgi:hypothetical protein
MSTPTYIRSTAGFRSITIFELSSGLPLGAATLEPYTPYTVSGSVISGSVVSVAAGTVVSGSVGYYGVGVTGARTLTINDPNPRVIPHIGDDGVFSLQVLPPTEPVTGELNVDKTNDTVDAIVSNVKKVTIGEAHFMGQSTNKRGYENQVGFLAFSAAQDTDPNSTTFGTNYWDFRIAPKAILFTKDSGYGQEANLRVYSVSPMYTTAHLWGVAYTTGTDGFTRGQLERGVSQYKPVVVGFLGDASTVSFPFDSVRPAQAAAKITVWKNGVIVSTGLTKSVSGLVFTAAPQTTDTITVFYETEI